MVKPYKYLSGTILVTLLLTMGTVYAEVTFENPYANPYQQTQQFVCFSEPYYHCTVPYNPGIYPGSPVGYTPIHIPHAGVGVNPYVAAATGLGGNPYVANPYPSYGEVGYDPFAVYAPAYVNDQDMGMNVPNF